MSPIKNCVWGVVATAALTSCATQPLPSEPANTDRGMPRVGAERGAVPVLTLDAAPPRGIAAEGFANVIPVQVDLTMAGQWTQWDERRPRLRWELNSPQAQTLSLHFSEFHLPPGAQMRIYDPGNLAKGMLQLSAHDNQPHGQYWTPQFATQRLRIDLVLSASQAGLALTLADINIAY